MDKSWWRKAAVLFLDIFFPVRCLNCSRPGEWLCPVCRRDFSILTQDVCPVCRRPSPYGKTHAWCAKETSLDGLLVAAQSHEILKQAIKVYKYQFVKDLAPFFCRLLLEKIQSADKQTIRPHWIHALFNSSVLVVVPVPLHARRYRWRGFNQAELLARLLCEKLNLSYRPFYLRRRKYTPPQAKLKRSRRLKNLRKSFQINPLYAKEIHGAKIILIDDIATTLATLDICAQTLKRAGALEVWGLVLQRG
jgi:ComF family protein